jgi:ribosomal protein S27E
MMEMKLESNAAGRMLQVIFPFDMTLVQATCAGCGTTNALEAVAAYMHGMGTVVRCQSCDTVLIRMAQVRGRYLLDMQGIRVLEIGAES